MNLFDSEGNACNKVAELKDTSTWLVEGIGFAVRFVLGAVLYVYQNKTKLGILHFLIDAKIACESDRRFEQLSILIIRIIVTDAISNNIVIAQQIVEKLMNFDLIRLKKHIGHRLAVSIEQEVFQLIPNSFFELQRFAGRNKRKIAVNIRPQLVGDWLCYRWDKSRFLYVDASIGGFR